MMKSEKTDEKQVTDNQANEAAGTLGIAAAQRKAERRHLWLIAGLATVLTVVLLLNDSTAWDAGTILMTAAGVMPPVFGIIASMCFLCYLIWQILHHRAIRQTGIAFVISLAIAAVWMIILPIILVVLGGFPAQG